MSHSMQGGACLASSVPFTEGGVLLKASQSSSVLLPGSMLPREKAKAGNGPRRFGIDCTDGLVFSRWEPGGEYTKNIVIKNILATTQKVTFTSPRTKYFTMQYPETIILSSGTSYAVSVTFRPPKKSKYEDMVEFTTAKGSFRVSLAAILPGHKLKIPKHATFGKKSIHEVSTMVFRMTNASDVLETNVRWETPAPFTIKPERCVLQPGATVSVTAYFQPTAAGVFVGNALCFFGHGGKSGDEETLGHHETLTLNAIGKFPRFAVSKKVVDFGKVPITNNRGRGSQDFQITNVSEVTASFAVRQVFEKSDSPFMYHPKEGKLAPGEKTTVKVNYEPLAADIINTDRLQVGSSSGKGGPLVDCRGVGVGSTVTLSTHFIDFGDVAAGNEVTRGFSISSESAGPSDFQIMSDNSSVFNFQMLRGHLAPHTTTSISVTFRPTEPINYLRNVFVFNINGSVHQLTLIGTCYSQQERPMSFTKKHVMVHHRRVARGLGLYSPDQLISMEQAVVEVGGDDDSSLEDNEDIKSGFVQLPSPVVSLFDDAEARRAAPSISLEHSHVNFGACSTIRLVEAKVIRIVNPTKGRVTCVWMTPDSGFFSVIPKRMDIPPDDSAVFRVHFRPQTTHQYHGGELECFCFHKQLKSFRSVTSESFVPPWCLTAHVSGHTFACTGDTAFLPKVELDQRRLKFPAIKVGTTMTKYVHLANVGDTAVHFAFVEEKNAMFRIRPSKGLLDRGEEIDLLVQFAPETSGDFKEIIRYVLNDSMASAKEIIVEGHAEFPSLAVGGSSPFVYFKPTAIGAPSIREVDITNRSRVPTRFQWNIPKQYQGLVQVSPESGVLMDGESQVQAWTFTPQECKRFHFRVQCHIQDDIGASMLQPTAAPVGQKKSIVVHVVGEGVQGAVVSKEKLVDFGTCMIGLTTTHTVCLMNPTGATLNFCLVTNLDEAECRIVPNNESDTDLATKHAKVIKFSEEQVSLPSHSSKTLTVEFSPARCSMHRYEIGYELVGDPKPTTKPLLSMVGLGVYPVLGITDARCDLLSKGILWNNLSLYALNEELRSIVTKQDLIFNVVTRGVEEQTSDVLKTFAMDFEAAPRETDPCVIYIKLENPSVVAIDWSFLFPNDFEILPEHWTGCGTDEYAANTYKMIENKTFSVKPRSGKLDPGTSQTVEMIYSHAHEGKHCLPVVFKLRRGKKVLLELKGCTVPLEKPYLHFTSDHHQFQPVVIGEPEHPLQTYRLYNGSSRVVKYTVDVSPFKQTAADNFGIYIFECHDVEGAIEPGETRLVRFSFRPIEAREYKVELPISVEGGDSNIICFTGTGLAGISSTPNTSTNQGARSGVDTSQEVSKTTVTSYSGGPRDRQQSVPRVQSIALPGQQVFLSMERLYLGDVALFARVHRIIVVSNRSSDDSVKFTWKMDGDFQRESLTVRPVSGTVAPGCDCVCTVTFCSKTAPCLHNYDIRCQVESVHDRQEYEEAVAKAAREARAAEDALEIVHGSPLNTRELKTMARKGSNGVVLGSVQKLPPIGKGVTEPKPSSVHLGIVARTHRQIKDAAHGNSSTFFLDAEVLAQRNESVAVPVANNVGLDKSEMGELLSHLLEDILCDESFIANVKDIPNEPLPYFLQFSNNDNHQNSQDGGASTMPPEESSDTMSTAEKECLVESIMVDTLTNIMAEIWHGC